MLDFDCFIFDLVIFYLLMFMMMFSVVGKTKSCLYAVKEWFKLRICVKREGKAKTVKAGNFRKIGKTLGLNC